MPPEKEIAANIGNIQELKGPLIVAGLFVVAHLGRILATGEEFCLTKFIGEILLAVVGGIVMAAFGMMQGMSMPEMVFWGGLAGMGGVRMVEWMFKIAKRIKENS